MSLRRLATIGVAIGCVVATGCSGTSGGAPTGSSPSARSRGASASAQPPGTSQPSPSVPPARWRARAAGWQLPSALSRMVAVADAGRLVLAGGLDATDNSTSAVTAIDPASGRARTFGRLAVPVHDSAGAFVGGRLTLFGGGGATETDAVQQLPRRGGQARVVGHLPEPRSDLSAVTIGRVTYVVGGYTGSAEVPTVLATTDGRRFRVVARLPVTVRYAAVAALDGAIWVVGGEHLHRFIDDVQRIDPRTGTARVVGHLPAPRGEAVAVPVGGRLLLVGGRDSAGSDSRVLSGAVSGRTLSWHRVASLPVPAADPGAAEVGGSVIVVGGERPGRTGAARVLTAG